MKSQLDKKDEKPDSTTGNWTAGQWEADAAATARDR